MNVQHIRIASTPSLCLADGDRPSTYAARYYMRVCVVGTDGTERDAHIVADIVRHRRQPGEQPELVAYVGCEHIGTMMPITFGAESLRQVGGDQLVLDPERLDNIARIAIEVYLDEHFTPGASP